MTNTAVICRLLDALFKYSTFTSFVQSMHILANFEQYKNVVNCDILNSSICWKGLWCKEQNFGHFLLLNDSCEGIKIWNKKASLQLSYRQIGARTRFAHLHRVERQYIRFFLCPTSLAPSFRIKFYKYQVFSSTHVSAIWQLILLKHVFWIPNASLDCCKLDRCGRCTLPYTEIG